MEQRATTLHIATYVCLLLLLWIVGGTVEGIAQTLHADERARLAPRLRPIAVETPAGRLDPLLSPSGRSGSPVTLKRGGERHYAVFVRTSDLEALRELDVSVHPVGGGLATARVSAVGLRSIAQVNGVESIRLARSYAPMNDVGRGATGIQAVQEGVFGRNYTGEGVVACVIDTGIDWAHRDFRGLTDSSTSRVRALWDQTLTPRPNEASPSEFGYGVEYTRRQIEEEIDGTPARTVRSTDTNGHGTHVAGTMAGNGAASPGRAHRGMAPDADIVAVKTDFTGVGIAQGLRYCGSVADDANQPVVVNLSLGTVAGPHDGSSPLAQVIGDFVGTGRSVVVAAGNGGAARRHVSRSLSKGASDSIHVQVPRYSAAEGAGNDVAFRLDVWLSGTGRVPATLITPSGTLVSLATDTAAAVQTADGTVVYENAVGPRGDRNLEIVVHDSEADAAPAQGTWTVVTDNESSAATTVHGWLVDTTTESRLAGGDRRYTLTTPAAAPQALTVGAWIPRGHWPAATTRDGSDRGTLRGGLAPFSGRGPVRGDVKKPDLVAPGQWTVSSRARGASLPSTQSRRGGDYATLRGTSTAAATTAGAVTLLFQRNPSLSGNRAAALLTENARTDRRDDRSWTPDRGHGMLDLVRAMAEQQGVTVATRDRMAYDEPVTGEDRTAYTLGGGKAAAMAVRFTPAQSGTVSGLYVHTGAATSTRLRDSLTVSVWTDVDGLPGQPIGSPARVAPGLLASHVMNFISLAETGVDVEKGTNYHVVLESGDEGGEVNVTAERRSVDGRSAVLRNGTWTALSTADLALRMTTALVLDLATPRLTAPEPSAVLESREPVTASWEPVADADTYAIQVSSSKRFPPARTDTFRTRTPSHTLTDLAPSRAYHWRVRAERNEYVGAWSSTRSFVVYPSTIDVQAARSFGAEKGGAGYRLVALPGARTTRITQTVNGDAGTHWEAFRDNGTAKEAFVRHVSSSPFRLAPGTGYWLRSDRGWSVRTSVPTVPLEEDGTYAIDLHDGWNIISNPFGLDVSWSAVETANDGPLPPLWRYSGAFEQVSTFASARTGEAFYVLNDQGRDALRIPYPAVPDAPAGASSTPDPPPGMTLTAHAEKLPAARVRVGILEDAENERDPYDRVAPPARFARLAFRVEAEGEDVPVRERELAADYRSAESDGHAFSLVLRAESDAPVQIQADGLDAFEGKQVVLVDPAAGESYDLRAGPTVTIRPNDGPRSFRLLVGSSDYVEAKKNVTLPSDLRFLPNYPNPFREQTTLEYTLPEPASVRLAVYDVLGRQVRVLVNEKQKAGRHTVPWNGRDESGRRMASGVYLARLVVDGQTKVRKMTFVR